MKKTFFTRTLITLIVCGLALSNAMAQSANYLTAKPMPLAGSLGSISSGTYKVPVITWGGDIATVLADMDGIFKGQGLNITLFREDDFQKQVQKCYSGETPFVRGTEAMINCAADALQAKGSDLVVIYQMTWSTGGDAMVARPNKTLDNIKTIALQLYGPHMDYAANLFSQKGRLGSVEFKWLQQLTISDPVGGKSIDPVSAFKSVNELDAVMCIIPDALALTSNGTVGTGSDNSVKGAKMILSTKTANRIIADVYAVRKDWFEAHKDETFKFVAALMSADEALKTLVKNKTAQQAKYRQLMSKSADVLMGSSQFTADVEAMLGDCEFVGYSGNVSFFGKGARNFVTLNKEIQAAFKTIGLMASSRTVLQANWNYADFTSGGLSVSKTLVESKKFDEKKVQAVVEKKISAESNTWEEEGTLFKVEIYFQPNQTEFTEAQYANDFAKALKIAQTYSGAIVVIEGHCDHGAISKAKQSGKPIQEVNQMIQTTKNLSLDRARNVKKTFLDYATKQGNKIDGSGFVAVGRGIDTPKYKKPTTKEEWSENFRVVFLIKQLESEPEVFDPSNY